MPGTESIVVSKSYGPNFNTKRTLLDASKLAVSPTVGARNAAWLGLASLGSYIVTNDGTGLVTGERVDMFWADGVRVGMLFDHLDGSNIFVTGGVGDAFPADNTPVQIVR